MERQDAEKRRVSKILCDLRGGRGASSDGAEGKVVGCKGGGMRETKVQRWLRDVGPVAVDHAAKVTAVIIGEVDFGGKLQKLGTVPFEMRGRVCETRAMAMQPVVSIGVVSDTGEVVQADDSGGDVHEGAEKIEKLIGGARGAAGQVGEVLRDVLITSRLVEGQ